MTLPNPWFDLPLEAPFVLPTDRRYVDAFNRSLDGGEQHPFWLQGHLVPQPFFGRLDAPVVILANNPGAGPSTADGLGQRYVELLLANLAQQERDFPFFPLHPDIRNDSPYWLNKLAPLARELGEDGIELIADGLLVVEFNPYWSKKWHCLPVTLPSQRFSFDVVERSVAVGAVVIVARAFSEWLTAVPALSERHQRDGMRGVPRFNGRNLSFSRRNCPHGFDQAVEKLASLRDR